MLRIYNSSICLILAIFLAGCASLMHNAVNPQKKENSTNYQFETLRSVYKPVAITKEEDAIIAKFYSIPINKINEYICDLGMKRDFRSLKVIYNRSSYGFREALSKYAAIIDSDQVIDFVSQYKVGTNRWRSAFEALEYHPRHKVIGYVRHVMKHTMDANVRYICYALCSRAGWDDLMDYSQIDQYSSSIIRGPFINESDPNDFALYNSKGQQIDANLGAVARDYMQQFASPN